MRKSSIVSILDQCIEAMAPTRSKDRYGDGYHTHVDGYKIGGGLSFDESPFLEALDAALEYWLMKHHDDFVSRIPLTHAMYTEALWHPVHGWQCSCLEEAEG